MPDYFNISPISFIPNSPRFLDLPLPQVHLPTLPAIELPSGHDVLVTAAELLSNLVISGSLGAAGGAIGSLVGLTVPIIGPETGALIFGGLFSALGDATNQCLQMYLSNGVITSLNTEQICAAGITGVLSGNMFGKTLLARLGFNFVQGVASRGTIEGMCALENKGAYTNGFDRKKFANNIFDFWKVISDVGFGEMLHHGFTAMQHWSPPSVGLALAGGNGREGYCKREERVPDPLFMSAIADQDAQVQERPTTISEYTQGAVRGPIADPAKYVSYADEYFQYDLTDLQIAELRAGKMKISGGVPPRERLFLCDDVITMHSFGEYDGRWWLVKDFTKDTIGENKEWGSEIVYGFAKKLQVYATETRVVTIDGEVRRASRFLENAIDGHLDQMPAEFVQQVESQLDSYFPFNYFMSLGGGGGQRVYTTDGKVVLIDYDILSLRVEIPFDRGHDFFELRSSEGRPLSTYLPMIERIEALTDAEIIQLTAGLPEQAMSYGELVTNYREQITARLIRNRNDIRKKFTRLLTKSNSF